jgi:hypothetical protein
MSGIHPRSRRAPVRRADAPAGTADCHSRAAAVYRGVPFRHKPVQKWFASFSRLAQQAGSLPQGRPWPMVARDENEGRSGAVPPRRRRLCTAAASASTERGAAHDDIRGGSAGSSVRTRSIRCANCSRTVECRAGPLLRSVRSLRRGPRRGGDVLLRVSGGQGGHPYHRRQPNRRQRQQGDGSVRGLTRPHRAAGCSAGAPITLSILLASLVPRFSPS